MKVIVHGSTGAQGAPVAEALRRSGHDVVAIARTTSAGDASRVAANFEDQASLEAAYAKADAVFLHIPILEDPQALGRWIPAVLGALANCNVQRVVLSTSGASLEDAGPDPMLQGRLAGMRTLYEGLQGAVASVVVLAPRLFLENLLLPFVAGPLQTSGVLAYPLPADKPVSWISHRDVAEAAVEAIEGRAEDGVYDLGYNALTGQELADQLSGALGRSVSYEAITPEEFSSRATPVLGEQVAAGVGALYEAFASDHTLEISAEARQLGLDRRLGVSVWGGEVLVQNDTQDVVEAVRERGLRQLRFSTHVRQWGDPACPYGPPETRDP